MASIIVPCDGSDAALRAVRTAIETANRFREKPGIELVNVQSPIRGDVSLFIGSNQIKDYHREEGLKALTPARALLDASGLTYNFHIGVGDPAAVIVQYEQQGGCLLICMATRGAGALGRMLLGSVAQKVVQLCAAPVMLVK